MALHQPLHELINRPGVADSRPSTILRQPSQIGDQVLDVSIEGPALHRWTQTKRPFRIKFCGVEKKGEADFEITVLLETLECLNSRLCFAAWSKLSS